MKKVFKYFNKKVIAALVLIAITVFVLTRGSADKKAIKTTPVTVKSIKSEIAASGKIITDNQSNLHFPISGRVSSILVKEGDFVKPGQVLATLDSQRLQIALRTAQYQLNVADAELEQVYDDVKKTEGIETFEEKIKRTTAEAKKTIAFDAVKKSQRDLEDVNLITPISGIVSKIEVNAKEEVFANTEIIKISGVDNLQFIAQVDETDILSVRSTQKGSINFEAEPEKNIDSFIKTIAVESVVTSTGSIAYEVTFEIPETTSYKPGMTGEVKILVDEVQNALVVPLETIQDDKYVWVAKGNRFEKIEIQTGLSSDVEVAVISGLLKDDRIVVSGFDEIGKQSLLDKILNR